MDSFRVKRVSDEIVIRLIETLGMQNQVAQVPEITWLIKEPFNTETETLDTHIDLHLHDQ